MGAMNSIEQRPHHRKPATSVLAIISQERAREIHAENLERIERERTVMLIAMLRKRRKPTPYPGREGREL
jgi:hypothetical protein